MKTFRTEIDTQTTATSFFGIKIFKSKFETATMFINDTVSRTQFTSTYYFFGYKYKTVITE